MSKKFIGYCKECGNEVFLEDKIGDYNIYECNECYYPNCKEDLQLEKSEKIRISKKIRAELWNEYCQLENRLKSLKTIVQNPIELTVEEIECHSKETMEIANELISIASKVVKSTCKE